MSKTNCRIYREINRPDKACIDAFENIPVANLDDCMGRMSAVDAQIKPVGKSGIVGPAVTVKVAEGDNLMMHYAMELVQEGDVLVIDAGGSTKRAVFGALMVNYLVEKKIAGIVVDGAIRDKEEIAGTGLPVYARGVTPDGPWKNGPGEVNTPVQIGGRVVYPGDIVVADSDGVVFIRPENAPALLTQVKKVMEIEASILAGVHKDGSMPRPWLMDKLTALGCEFHDHWEE